MFQLLHQRLRLFLRPWSHRHERKPLHRHFRESGGEAAFFHADVTKDAEINAAFDGAIETFGPYNVLFNHAGTIIVKAMHETSEEEYDWLMDVNVKSAFLTCRRAVQDMSANDHRLILRG